MQHITFSGPVREFARRWPLRHRHATLSVAPPTAVPPLVRLVNQPEATWPDAVRQSPVARKYLKLFQPINWAGFPQRAVGRAWPGPAPRSALPYVLALLMRIDQRHQSMGQTVAFLHQHPEVAWLAGFATPDPATGDVAVPSAACFSQILRHLANDALQYLLDETVRNLAGALPASVQFGDTVAFDTKHILAWVKENNPKTYIAEGRFDKTRQPAGDADCKLGCKRRRNQGEDAPPPPPTPAGEALPAERLGSGIGEFYWGYASGVVVTKVPTWGEFVLAERTDTFNQSDVSYFFPLMAQVERRLGFRPRNGTGDAAFDAFYIYDYFHAAGGMAAIPTGDRTKRRTTAFADDGTPLCPAGLPMRLKVTYFDRTAFVPHEHQRWACPVRSRTADQPCPIAHEKWDDGGCVTSIAASIGARLRHQLDREGETYRAIYQQRTACERIFSRAVNLGIERPKLRNGHSIANFNTLLYVLLNLRALQQVIAMRANSAAD